MAKKDNKMTLETLAEMIGRGFKEAQDDRAVIRGELQEVRSELKEDVAILRRDMEARFTDMGARFTAIDERMKDLPTKVDLARYATAAEFKLLEQRVTALERARKQRAA
jgi:hypothetical protein